MTISAAQQKLQQEQSTSGVESLTSSQPSPSDVGGTASSTAGSSTTTTAKTNPTITTTGTPTASDAKAQQQPSPTPGSLASSLLSGMILLLSHYLLGHYISWICGVKLITHRAGFISFSRELLVSLFKHLDYVAYRFLVQWVRPMDNTNLAILAESSNHKHAPHRNRNSWIFGIVIPHDGIFINNFKIEHSKQDVNWI